MREISQIETMSGIEFDPNSNVHPLHPNSAETDYYNTRMNHEDQPDNSMEIAVITGRVAVGRSDVPWSFKIGEDQVHNGVSIAVPGYFGIKASMEDYSTFNARNGFPTLYYEPPRWADHPLLSLKDAQNLHVMALEAVTQDLKNQKFMIKQNTPDGSKLDLDRFIITDHSMGGHAGTKFAESHRTQVDMVVNQAALGYNKFSLGRLLTEAPIIAANTGLDLMVAQKDGTLKLTRRDMLKILKYCLTPQTVGEVMSCFTETVLDEAATLRENDVPIAYLAFGGDVIVPPDENIAREVDYYHVIPNVGHLAIASEAEKIAGYTAATFHKLSNKQKVAVI